MSNSEYARQKRLDRRADAYGLSVHHCKEGYYLLINSINAIWSAYGTFHATLDEVEELLDLYCVDE